MDSTKIHVLWAFIAFFLMLSSTSLTRNVALGDNIDGNSNKEDISNVDEDTLKLHLKMEVAAAMKDTVGRERITNYLKQEFGLSDMDWAELTMKHDRNGDRELSEEEFLEMTKELVGWDEDPRKKNTEEQARASDQGTMSRKSVNTTAIYTVVALVGGYIFYLFWKHWQESREALRVPEQDSLRTARLAKLDSKNTTDKSFSSDDVVDTTSIPLHQKKPREEPSKDKPRKETAKDNDLLYQKKMRQGHLVSSQYHHNKSSSEDNTNSASSLLQTKPGEECRKDKPRCETNKENDLLYKKELEQDSTSNATLQDSGNSDVEEKSHTSFPEGSGEKKNDVDKEPETTKFNSDKNKKTKASLQVKDERPLEEQIKDALCQAFNITANQLSARFRLTDADLPAFVSEVPTKIHMLYQRASAYQRGKQISFCVQCYESSFLHASVGQHQVVKALLENLQEEAVKMVVDLLITDAKDKHNSDDDFWEQFSEGPGTHSSKISSGLMSCIAGLGGQDNALHMSDSLLKAILLQAQQTTEGCKAVCMVIHSTAKHLKTCQRIDDMKLERASEIFGIERLLSQMKILLNFT